LQVCSPLAGYDRNHLAEMISNPFHPPPPGSDDPHQGVDFAILAAGSKIALAGNPVQAVIPGVVVTVIDNRFPYGYAVLIETPLEPTGSANWEQANLPTPAPTLEPRSALTCPDTALPPAFSSPARSLYLLYAHLQSPVALQPGQAVSCGQVVGAVGRSGNALNEHLHLEARVAPAGFAFKSMAHYDASASQEEMAAYCLWRISGLFQLVDPLTILASD
jgi:murein DD-endopeptidase MepM/ murein hydrolase activator NlpD